MKKLIVLLALLAGINYAQFPDSIAVTIDSLGVNSSIADLNGEKLLSVGFPATVTSDTFFVQTRQTTTGAWQNVYYTGSTGSKTRLIILTQASSLVSFHPDQTFHILRYVRIVADDAEADDRTLTVYKGNY